MLKNIKASFISVKNFIYLFAALLAVILLNCSNSREVYFLFLGSVIITIVLIANYIKRPFDFLDPIIVFSILSLIAYPIKYLICDMNPSLLFFNDSVVNFQYDEADYLKTIFYYFIGYFGFIIGYIVISASKISFDVQNEVSRIKNHKLSSILAVTVIFNIVSYILQYKFQIGLLLAESPVLGMRLTGILFYFFIFGSGFLLLLYLHAAVRDKKTLHIIASFGILIINSFLSVMSFSKAGFFNSLITILLISIVLKENEGKVPKYIKRMAMAALLMFLLLFPIIQLYRFSVLESGAKRGFESLWVLFEVGKENLFSYDLITGGLKAVFKRIPGFDVLLPIVAYGKNESLLNMRDFIGYLRGNGTGDYANFFKTEIMCIPAIMPTGFEVSLLGFLYIYFGAVGIAVGMFLWGMLNKLFFGAITRFYFSNPVYGFPILSIYITSFIGITFGFGANTIIMIFKTFIATLFLLIFWRKYFGKID